MTKIGVSVSNVLVTSWKETPLPRLKNKLNMKRIERIEPGGLLLIALKSKAMVSHPLKKVKLLLY